MPVSRLQSGFAETNAGMPGEGIVMIKRYVITEDELRYLVEGFVYQEHETTLEINDLVRSRLVDDIRLFTALDELYKFVDGLDPDFIIRERISIIKSRLLKRPEG